LNKLRLAVVAGCFLLATAAFAQTTPLVVSISAYNSPGPIGYPYASGLRPLLGLGIQVTNPNDVAATGIHMDIAAPAFLRESVSGPRGGGSWSASLCGTGYAREGNVPALAKFLSTNVTYSTRRASCLDAAISSSQIVRIRMS